MIAPTRRSRLRPLLAAVLLTAVIAGAGCSAGAGGGHAHDEESGDLGTGLDHHGRPIGTAKDPIHETATQNGVTVDFTVEGFSGVGGRNGTLTPEIAEGDHATVTFRLTDEQTGAPLGGLRPAAWIDLVGESPRPCPTRVQGYIDRDPAGRPEIDLNGFFLLALNSAPSISVIDPSVDLGGLTQLFTLIALPGPGADWAMAADGERLVVTVPSVKQVVVIDTGSFEVVERIDVGGEPSRAVADPDGESVWVGVDGGPGEWSGVAVIDPVRKRIARRVATGPGHHEIAFGPHGRRAYVSNSGAGSLSIIDVARGTEDAEVEVGPLPVAVDVAPGTGDVYVANRGDGTVSVVDDTTRSTVGSIPIGAGLNDLRVAPGGRAVFATASQAGRAVVIDATTRSARRTIDVAGAPDQIGFGAGGAYIRRSASAAVTRIELPGLLGRAPVQSSSLAVGERPPALATLGPGAGFVVEDPGGDAVMIANPGADKVVYHVAGAPTTAGSFRGDQLGPRAVKVVDRGLRETSPGVYAGKYRVPASGAYSAALFVDQPRLAECFSFEASPDPETALAAAPALKPLGSGRRARVGRPYTLRFRLADVAGGGALTDVPDATVTAGLSTGWSTRVTARHRSGGVYTATFTPPEAGLYEIVFAVPSLAVDADRLPRLFLTAR